MRKLSLSVIISGALAMALAAATIPAHAQDQDAQTTQARQMRSPDEIVQRLGEKLNLTDDQKTQIKPIIQDRQEKMQALRSDTSLRRRQRARKMKGILEDSDKKIKAILTPDQQKQYEAMEQQMREQRKQRRQNRNSSE